jgi:hypothetical protein
MANVRDEAISALKRLPKNSSTDDLLYRIYVLEKIRKGEQSLREHGPVSHEQAKTRMRRWLSK